MSKQNNTGAMPAVPTTRYRVLAIVFFLLAVAGLFIGAIGQIGALANLGNFGNVIQRLFSHTKTPLYQNGSTIGIGLSEGTLVGGSLFGYVYEMLKFFFTNFTFSDSPAFIVNEFLGIAQVLLIAVAVVASLVLGVTSCIVKKTAARKCAMISGFLVATAYLWPFLTVMFFAGSGEAAKLHTAAGTYDIAFLDYPLAIIGGITLVLLLITSLARRKWVGLINVLLVVLLGVFTVVATYHNGETYKELEAMLEGLSQNAFFKYAAIVFAALLGLNLLLAVWRLNGKRAYPFDAVRYGLLFLSYATLIVGRAIAERNWAIFTANYYLATIGLGILLIAFVLSIVNCFLVIRRRNALKARRIAAEAAKDAIDRESDFDDVLAAPAAPAAAGSFQTNIYTAPQTYPAYQSQAPYMQTPSPYPMMGGGQAPIIFQQAPAAPPVIVLQVPPYNQPEAAPVQTAPAPAPAPVQTAPFVPVAPVAPAAEGPAAEAPAQAPEQVPAQAPATRDDVTDPFFKTLTEEEEKEFVTLFVEKKRGEFGLPTYAVDGDNASFFKRFFSALGKFRPYISSELLGKVDDYIKK